MTPKKWSTSVVQSRATERSITEPNRIALKEDVKPLTWAFQNIKNKEEPCSNW